MSGIFANVARGYDAIHVHGNSATLVLEMMAAKMAGVPLPNSAFAQQQLLHASDSPNCMASVPDFVQQQTELQRQGRKMAFR